MKNILRILFISVVLAAARGSLRAEDEILGIIPDARSSSMGGISAPAAPDPFSLYHNPAALGAIRRTELSYTDDALFGKRKYWTGGLAYSLRDVRMTNLRNLGTLAAGYSSLVDEGKTTLITGGYGKLLYENPSAGEIYGGAAVKRKTEEQSGDDTETVLVDAGVFWKYPLMDLNSGLTVRNIGGEDRSPLACTAGASLRPLKNSLLLAAEIDVNEDSDTVLRIGSEYMLINALMLRAGYNYMEDQDSGVTAGTGLIFKNVDVMFTFIKEIDLDYAYVSYTGSGGIHRLSAVFKLGAD